MEKLLHLAIGLGIGLSFVPENWGQHSSPVLDPPQLAPVEKASEEDSAVASSFSFSSEPSVEWTYHKTEDGAHPNGNEQKMVWLMNRARTDPLLEGVYLADTGNGSVESAISYFGVDKAVLMQEFSELSAKQPAAFDRRIYEGSLAHSLDLIARDAQDHNQQFDRVRDAGFHFNGGAASVFAYAKSPVYAHAGFNIDWGYDGGDGTGMQVGRGHRRGLMATSLNSSNVGIAMVAENDSGTSVGPLVTSIVYARASTSYSEHYNQFLVGTVWSDSNGNSEYDSGEGLSGVKVTPDTGTYFAITGSAGGWAIPISEGSYVITFSGGQLADSEQRSVTVGGSNSVLVVWNAADSFVEEELLQPPAAPSGLSAE